MIAQSQHALVQSDYHAYDIFLLDDTHESSKRSAAQIHDMRFIALDHLVSEMTLTSPCDSLGRLEQVAEYHVTEFLHHLTGMMTRFNDHEYGEREYHVSIVRLRNAMRNLTYVNSDGKRVRWFDWFRARFCPRVKQGYSFGSESKWELVRVEILDKVNQYANAMPEGYYAAEHMEYLKSIKSDEMEWKWQKIDNPLYDDGIDRSDLRPVVRDGGMWTLNKKV